HRSPRDRRRDRVVVQVETDVWRLADVRFGALVADERMLGQTEQARTLLFENVAHQLLFVLLRAALGGRRLAPLERLAVEVVEVSVLSRGKEARAHVLDAALDSTLFVTARYRHRPRLVAV